MAMTADPVRDGAGEGRLVGLAQRGVAEARERLAARHRRSAYLLALQLLGNPDDALDVAQESMLRFFGRLESFDAGRPVRPWLFQIVRNQVRDLRRRRRVRKSEPLEPEAGDLSRQIADPSQDPEASAAAAELRRRIWRALSTLGERQREILVLRDYHDLAYAEMAEVLKIPVGTVMSRLHGARKALRRVLGPAREAGAGHAERNER